VFDLRELGVVQPETCRSRVVSNRCTQCSRAAHDVSQLDSEQARELTRTAEGRVCVRFHQRPDGRLMTAPCPNERSKRIAAVWFAASLAAGLLLWSAHAVWRRTSATDCHRRTLVERLAAKEAREHPR
jgi:hypothetical protein